LPIARTFAPLLVYYELGVQEVLVDLHCIAHESPFAVLVYYELGVQELQAVLGDLHCIANP